MNAHSGHVADKPATEDQTAVFATYDTHEAAEKAVRDLQTSGFDMKKLSIVGKDYQKDEAVVGYYTTGDRMKAWGKMGAFWGGLWGVMFGSAFRNLSTTLRHSLREITEQRRCSSPRV